MGFPAVTNQVSQEFRAGSAVIVTVAFSAGGKRQVVNQAGLLPQNTLL